MNHLEELVGEWLEYNGYFVRRNVMVGRRPNGGYECELDIVAFHPTQHRLVHVEPSLDAHSWEKREARFAKKFAAGRTHIPGMFDGLRVPATIDHIALLVFASTTNRTTLGGGRIVHVSALYREILTGIRDRRVESQAVPEQFPLIRTIQQCQQYCDVGSSPTIPDTEGEGIGIVQQTSPTPTPQPTLSL
ncbi:MAG: hypothetical protein JNL08_00800 [Planctomycetes bacterium]|nr:hypothetical protein [Planctomycetota bacterium]